MDSRNVSATESATLPAEALSVLPHRGRHLYPTICTRCFIADRQKSLRTSLASTAGQLYRASCTLHDQVKLELFASLDNPKAHFQIGAQPPQANQPLQATVQPQSAMAPSVVKSLAFAAVVSSAALYDSSVDAHQNVILPAPTFTNSDKNVYWNPLAFLENQGFKTTADFNAYYKAKGYKSLRAFMDDKNAYKVDAAGANFECGYTNINGKRQPIPAGTIRSTGYTHDGPCEVWLDNTKVMSGTNCNKDFPGKTHSISYASCKGSCTLRWYWMGIRFLKNKYSWQVYKECVPIGSGRRLEGEEAEGDGERHLAVSNVTSTDV